MYYGEGDISLKNLRSQFGVVLMVVLILAVIFSGCADKDKRDSKKDQSKEKEVVTSEDIDATREAFDQYCEALAKRIIEDSPLNATFMYGDLESRGLESLLYELDDASIEATEAQIEDANKVLEYLKTLDKKHLTTEQKKTYEMLIFQNKSIVAGEDYIYYYNAFQPSSGVQIDIPIDLMQIELESEKEVVAYIERIKQLPRLFKQFIEYEYERANKGLTLPENLYETVLEQMDELLVEPEKFILYLSFCDRVDLLQSIDTAQKDKYKAEFLEIVKNDIYPVYDEMKIALEEIKTLTTNTMGLPEWENGQEYYDYLVKYGTSYNIDAEDLRQWAEDRLGEASYEIQLYFSNHPEFAEKELSEILPQIGNMEELYKMEEQFLEKSFMDYGIVRASENRIPPYLEEHLPPAFYFPISIDGEDYGNMYMAEEAFSNVSMETFEMDIHENIPGHHLYFSVLYGSDLPLIRKVYDFLAYTEGWAQYVQGKTYRFSAEDEETARFWDNFLAFNAAYSVILDIEVNYDGMPKEEAINKMITFGYDKEGAESSYNRMLANPCEMIDYNYGSYVIEKYLKECMNKQKANFNIKEFHDLILQNAALPFTSMDDVIEEYLEN